MAQKKKIEDAVYIYDAIRVPIGKANGIYKNILPENLAAFLIQKLLTRNNLSNLEIEEIILANAFGTGGNMARYASLSAGLDESISAFTIDSQCSGGLKSVELGASLIKSSSRKLLIVGGMESKSLAPKKAYQSNDERFDTSKEFFTTAKFSPNQVGDFPLLEAAKNVAIKYKITKEEMLIWANDSHRKASLAQENGILDLFVEKIEKNHSDQSIRPGIDLARLATNDLIDRTVSAHYNDAAACILLGNTNSKLIPIAKIIASASIGVHPEFAPEGVIFATKMLFENSEIKMEEVDLFEINESFALIPFIFAKVFGVEKSKINVLGGNLAYGHPFGASGAINLIHLIASLKYKKLKYGLAVIPAAGGQATAVLIENI
ncbi:thiolase family protein [Lacihabitans soyangensis]|uniref:Thiolase family protein n=1 Tax=Lacihabitans soyangensis TaxID=869394 RepID=A0AAE3H5H6_9BACT|nr:thiolase family protein [Lacihabitans soyangensis]MCP9763395.1 thiolase family protein [Lacihabitans soyangensis]